METAGGQEPSAATLPGRVRQVLVTRLAQLSPGARGVIEAAAVIGRAFTDAVSYTHLDVYKRQFPGGSWFRYGTGQESAAWSG